MLIHLAVMICHTMQHFLHNVSMQIAVAVLLRSIVCCHLLALLLIKADGLFRILNACNT